MPTRESSEGRTGEGAATTLVCVDTGTTNTRVWLVDGERILARQEAAVGARDTARDGDDRRLRTALSELIAGVRAHAEEGAGPRRVAAAGMITSPQGVHEVPHLVAPVGTAELAEAAQERLLPDVCDLPFVFVPGVRTTSIPGTDGGVGGTDVMRGEETLAVGLLGQGLLAPDSALLNVGSHWKVIGIDKAGRVAWSLTSLAGEMMQAVRAETILASAVPPGPLTAADVTLLSEGMDEARRSGLARALFCVRLLELSGGSRARGRLSFLVGAFIGAELDRLQARGAMAKGTPVTLSGDAKLGGAWAMALDRGGCPVRSLSAAETESGFLAGLGAILAARPH